MDAKFWVSTGYLVDNSQRFKANNVELTFELRRGKRRALFVALYSMLRAVVMASSGVTQVMSGSRRYQVSCFLA